MRFLVDENLSPTLAEICRHAGYDATSVRDRGMLNATDREISQLCFEEDRILVTNNADDFLALADEASLHPGLIFIPLGSGVDMRSWMESAIEEIEHLAVEARQEPRTLMVNAVLDVEENGACQLFEYP